MSGISYDVFDIHSSVSVVHPFFFIANIPLYEYATIGIHLVPC